MNYEERIKWFNHARFGMFIHWGLYSILGRGEWVMFSERISKQEYAKIAEKFNPPKKFSPESWVKLAKEAGMKYIVLTARHHDGFCLFDSKVSEFTSVKTTAKRDFVREYVKACRKHNIKVGIYYSLLDWRFPGYFDREKYPDSFNEMVQQSHSQVKELMTNYGKIDYIFYDGEWIPNVKLTRDMESGKGESSEISTLWRAKELNKMVRELQSAIIINNRSGIDEDVDTPEQYITPSSPGRACESCITIGDSCGWGYIKHNPNLKTVPQLIQNLVQCASGGGNYILNVGPKPDGSIQKEFVSRLKEIGKWMGKNSESIYGSERIPSIQSTWGAGIIGLITIRDKNMYVHIFRWPGKTAVIPGIKSRILSAKFLATGKKINFEQTGDGKVILSKMPENPIDKFDTVVVLKTSGIEPPIDYAGIPL